MAAGEAAFELPTEWKRIDLVWPSPGRNVSGSAGHSAPISSRSSATPPVAFTAYAESQSRQLSVPPATRPTQASSPLMLDAATADRLAEDILRRVDRRARIERERRGL